MFAVICAREVDASEYVVSIDAGTPAEALDRATAAGHIVSRAVPLTAPERAWTPAAPITPQYAAPAWPAQSELLRRPVWTIAKGIVVGWLLLAGVGIVLWVGSCVVVGVGVGLAGAGAAAGGGMVPSPSPVRTPSPRRPG